MKKLVVILFMINGINIYGQSRVSIPGSEVRTITSSIVKSQEYELHIGLPAGYKNSTKKYPVLYLMDSQWDFPLVSAIYGQQYFDGFIPEIIIVGVTWGGIKPNPDSLRARDYTPTKTIQAPQSGGADQFLSFMKSELFPFIESNYRADDKNRTLMGCSLGGLVTLYALFTHTDMFTGYVAASPAIGWDGEVIYQYEKTFFQAKALSYARLYLTEGAVERGVPGFEKFTKFLNERRYPLLNIRSRVLENTGHSGTKTETFSRGLQYVFERPALQLDASVLNKYVGSYKGPNGGNIELKNENGQLMAYFGPNKYVLYASSEKDFYSTSEFLNVHFTTAGNSVDGFRLDRYGGSITIKRNN